MVTCVICGRTFTAKRSDAECCSSNCRNKKSKERAKQMALMRPFTWTLEQWVDVKMIQDISPEAYQHLEQIRIKAGVAVAQHALDAIHQIACVAPQRTVR